MALENGVDQAGTIGRGTHLGEPLTCEQIRELPDGAEVVITWCGGNGPDPYRILVDTRGLRRVERTLHNTELLPFDRSCALDGELQTRPLHRVTLGWDEPTRAWYDQMARIPWSDHLVEREEILRGIPQPQWTPLQIRQAGVLEELRDRLAATPWITRPVGQVVEREHLSVALNEVSRGQFGDRWLAMVTPPGPPADADPDDREVAAVLIALEEEMMGLAWESYGGLPVVDRCASFEPVDTVAKEVFGQHWQRALSRARRERDR